MKMLYSQGNFIFSKPCNDYLAWILFKNLKHRQRLFFNIQAGNLVLRSTEQKLQDTKSTEKMSVSA